MLLMETVFPVHVFLRSRCAALALFVLLIFTAGQAAACVEPRHDQAVPAVAVMSAMAHDACDLAAVLSGDTSYCCCISPASRNEALSDKGNPRRIPAAVATMPSGLFAGGASPERRGSQGDGRAVLPPPPQLPLYLATARLRV